MGLIISIKDTARQAVEAATGGQVTIMYDDRGYPSHMVRVPVFNIEDIDPALGSGVHPMFKVGGVTKSEIWLGQYPAIIHDGRALSLPGKDPAANINFDNAASACAAKGPGWHMTTNAEWAGVALLSHLMLGADKVRGNTDYGRDHVATYETAPRQDGGLPGAASGTARTLTGAGPASWRHNGDFGGIADLVGNVWEWVRGLRIVDGEIQIIADNDAADNTVSHAVGSAAWRAILEDGSLVAPGTANTLKYTHDSGVKVTKGALAGSVGSSLYKAVGASAGTTPPAILKLLGLYPHAVDMNRGYLYANVADECMPLRGGTWSNAGNAGLFALTLGTARSHASPSIGFRPAFVL